MITSHSALEILDEIASTSSKNEKVEILRKAMHDGDFFRDLMVWALDPMITFGFKDLSFVEEIEDDGTRLEKTSVLFLDEYTWWSSGARRLLDDLHTRKLTGTEARNRIFNYFSKTDAPTRELLRRVLQKDLRAGFSGSSVNKAYPGTIFDFSVMLADKLERDKLKFPVFVEPKFDGMRLLAIGDANGFRFFSRSGKEVSTVSPKIHDSLVEIYIDGTDRWLPESQMVFDGELMGESFKDTMEQARRKDSVFEDGVFYLFDALPYIQFKRLKVAKSGDTYKQRRGVLKGVVDSGTKYPQVVVPPSYLCNSMEEVDDLYAKHRERGYEGLVIKNPDGLYHPRRHRDWMKLKGVESADVPLVGAVEGTGKYEGMLGALIVNVLGVEVNVGTGFSDEQRETYWQDWLSGRLEKHTLVEVEYHEMTPDGSLRHPRFKRFRSDKRIKDGIGC